MITTFAPHQLIATKDTKFKNKTKNITSHKYSELENISGYFG